MERYVLFQTNEMLAGIAASCDGRNHKSITKTLNHKVFYLFSKMLIGLSASPTIKVPFTLEPFSENCEITAVDVSWYRNKHTGTRFLYRSIISLELFCFSQVLGKVAIAFQNYREGSFYTKFFISRLLQLN